MATQFEDKYSELISLSQSQLGWNKACIKFFVVITALCKLQAVCFSQLAQSFEEMVEVGSDLLRIQRFFAGFAVDNIVTKLIFSLLPQKPPRSRRPGSFRDAIGVQFDRIEILLPIV